MLISLKSMNVPGLARGGVEPDKVRKGHLEKAMLCVHVLDDVTMVSCKGCFVCLKNLNLGFSQIT